jgi:hypothetical protein
LLWTPGYWAWSDGLFIFHEGYWGPRVGFYGGIYYGFGYFGLGYEGGYWQNGAFFYNRAVNNVTNVTNVYNKTVIINNTAQNISYNGGEGGTNARPTAQEEAAAAQRHIPPTPLQVEHVQTASTNRQLFESTNHGRPSIAATAKPVEFSGHSIVEAKAAGPSYRASSARSAGPGGASGGVPKPETSNAVHPNDLPPFVHSNDNAGQMDQKYQQEQERLFARQEKERQELQKEQDQEHQRLIQGRASQAERQQVEQRHRQQTQQLMQRHSQEQQRFEQTLPRPKR